MIKSNFRTSRHNSLIPLLGLLLLIVISISCSRTQSDRDRILKLVEAVEKYAENRYIASIMDLLSQDFSDMENRTKPEMESLLESYFERYSGIVVNILGTRFITLSSRDAEIETEVALSSGAARFLRKLVSYSGQTYRFGIQLKKTEETWKVYHVQWREIFLDELFPESMDILKKLFPRLYQ